MVDQNMLIVTDQRRLPYLFWTRSSPANNFIT